MNIRVALILAGVLSLAGGAFAQNRPQAATQDKASAARETPATDLKPAINPAPPTTDNLADAKTPETQAAPTDINTPAAAAASAKVVTPVVTAPPAKTEAPVTAKLKDQEPASAGATSPPVVATPTTEKPAAEAPAPKPTMVMVPLPEKRPNIPKSLVERTEPAKYLFSAVKLPSTGPSRVIGYYSRGCLQGAVELPITGPTWQVMRLSRNRNWGDPELIRFIKRFSAAAAKATGWPGLLIGDMAQPRGGPLPYGHVSHQVGLDVDIWYTPMPDRVLTRKQRETMSATHMVAANGLTVNKNFTAADAAFLRIVAQRPNVQRVLVNAAIKKKMCELEGRHHYAWMAKLRPWYGHTSHIHVRLICPADSPHCRHQPPVPRGDGCGKKELAYWFSDRVLHPKPAKHPRPRKEIMLAELPAACRVVLNAPAKRSHLASEER